MLTRLLALTPGHLARTLALALLTWVATPGGAQAHEHGPVAPSAAMPASQAPSAMHHPAKAPDACTDTGLRCAVSVTPMQAPDGRLWLAWSAGGAVSVAQSSDQGAHFSEPTVIGQHGAMMDNGSDARPQIVADRQGRITVAYGTYKDKQYNAQLMVATSTDHGATFSPARVFAPEAASQRFPALALGPDGKLFMAWLDKGRVAAAKQKGVTMQGAAVAYAWSDDGGRSFGPTRLVQDDICECCRLAATLDAQGRPVMLFRQIFANSERDHAVVTVGSTGQVGPLQRVSHDQWVIQGCPHHGPNLAVANDGRYHVAWFTQGQARQGLFYARSDNAGQRFSPPMPVGDAAQQAGRPCLLAQGDSVWLAWKEFDGQQVLVKARHSADGGQTWSPDRLMGQTRAQADHPVLTEVAGRTMLSWMTREHGYRLMSLDTP